MKILPKIHQIAHQLQKPGFSTAFVLHEFEQTSTCYYARFPKVELKTPSSAVVKLLQGLFDQKKDHSFFILRQRIWTDFKPSVMDLGMVKVVAKRISQINPESLNIKLTEQFIEIGNSEDLFYPVLHKKTEIENDQILPTDEQVWGFLNRLSQKIPRGEVLHDFHRPVAAVLVDSRGNILSAGTNSSAINKTLHAEVNVIQDFYLKSKGHLPIDAKLFVTHKPCKMCAAMIVQMSEGDRAIEVKYQIEEDGCLSKHTALSKYRL